MIRRTRESRGSVRHLGLVDSQRPERYQAADWRTLGDPRLTFRERLAIWLARYGGRWDVKLAALAAWLVLFGLAYAMCAEAGR